MRPHRAGLLLPTRQSHQRSRGFSNRCLLVTTNLSYGRFAAQTHLICEIWRVLWRGESDMTRAVRGEQRILDGVAMTLYRIVGHELEKTSGKAGWSDVQGEGPPGEKPLPFSMVRFIRLP